MTEEEASQYTPEKNGDGRVIEDVKIYVARMHATLLPHFPEELLVEWLYRHHNCLYNYAFLFESLRFERQSWKLEEIPGCEAFSDQKFCETFSRSFDVRARDPFDWLARYMNQKGTWNTPVVLLENVQGDIVAPAWVTLRRPYHLMEGHRRLSFLIALRNQGRALDEHTVWLARKAL
jgi:hypothetical protein